MKLKNRFIMIIVGTFLVPALVASLVIFLFTPDFMWFRREHAGMREFLDQLDAAENLDGLVSLSSDFPKELFFYVFDEDRDIIYRRETEDKVRLFEEDTGQHTIITRQVVLSDGKAYTVMIGAAAVSMHMPYPGLIVLISVLAFLSFLSAWTMRSINRSIKQLEEGTRRIADGDLDTPIVVHGDDTFVSLANSFDTMRKKVKEENDRRMRFFMGVSHDLKTPLSSITGYSEALLDGLAEDDETRDRYVRIIHEKGKLLDQRISHLIQYIKLTNNNFQYHLKLQPLVPFLRDFIDLQHDEASLQGYVFEAEMDLDSDELVAFDPELLSRAMENLLQNSVHYGDPSRPVRLSCGYRDDLICIAFSNHHLSPMPDDVVKHMFEPFYRGDQSRKGEGFGLGLASVKSIVESHGWEVQGYSLEREGITVFQILIPKERLLPQLQLSGE